MTCTCCNGACCTVNGTCSSQPPSNCSPHQFIAGKTCGEVSCRGACCYGSTQSSCFSATEVECAQLVSNSRFMGYQTTCGGGDICRQGACCYTQSGFGGTQKVCTQTTQAGCASLGGSFYGRFVPCSTDLCDKGACCRSNGLCTLETAAACAAISGATFKGAGVQCGEWIGTAYEACAPEVPCGGSSQASGGAGVTVRFHSMGSAAGTVTFTYDAFGVPDAFKVEGGGQVFVDIPSTSGSGVRQFTKPSGVSTVKVTVTGPSGTAWEYSISCPNPLP